MVSPTFSFILPLYFISSYSTKVSFFVASGVNTFNEKFRCSIVTEDVATKFFLLFYLDLVESTCRVRDIGMANFGLRHLNLAVLNRVLILNLTRSLTPFPSSESITPD